MDAADRSHGAPRRSALNGLTRALIDTLGPVDALPVLLAEFGWDATFQALAAVGGPDAASAFGAAWEHLVVTPIDAELR